MSELNRTKIDVDIDTNKYNAVEIGSVNYYRKDWMVWKMVEYAKDKVGQMSERIKELEALVPKNESLHDVTSKQVYYINTYPSVVFVGVRKVENNMVHFSTLKDNGDLSNTVRIWCINEFNSSYILEPSMYLNYV
jgi:hypothetical protein